MSESEYQPLSPKTPAWGEVTVSLWDSEVFGFPVATYRPADASAISRNLAEVGEHLKRWAVGNNVELIGCSLPATEAMWRLCLPRLGFFYVDSTLTYTQPKLHRAKFPRSYAVRLAVMEDRQAVERIAEQAFNVGRFHADPFFPRSLANLRFRRWLGKAFLSLSSSSRIYVTGESGAVTAFTHSNVEGDRAYITIGGADVAFQGRGAGAAVFLGTLEALRDSGVRRAQSKLSASNTAMMNLTAYAGCRFSDPEQVYHWHAPNARHLLDRKSLTS